MYIEVTYLLKHNFKVSGKVKSHCYHSFMGFEE